MSNRILVPIDGSEGSIKALQYAMDLAGKMDGELILLNVQPNFYTPNAKLLFSKKDVEEYTQSMASEALAEAKAIVEGSGLSYEVKTRIGVPKTEIGIEAKESKADSIVMGYRGMGAIVGTMLGSVSFGVLSEAPCPVTIVP